MSICIPNTGEAETDPVAHATQPIATIELQPMKTPCLKMNLVNAPSGQHQRLAFSLHIYLHTSVQTDL